MLAAMDRAAPTSLCNLLQSKWEQLSNQGLMLPDRMLSTVHLWKVISRQRHDNIPSSSEEFEVLMCILGHKINVVRHG